MQSDLTVMENPRKAILDFIKNWSEKMYPVQIADELGLNPGLVQEEINKMILNNELTIDEVY